MKHEIISELREIVVNVKLTDDRTPVISTSRGYEFTPKTLHALWVRASDEPWTMAYVELKGKLPKSGKNVNRTYWGDVEDLPDWIGSVVRETVPSEAKPVTS